MPALHQRAGGPGPVPHRKTSARISGLNPYNPRTWRKVLQVQPEPHLSKAASRQPSIPPQNSKTDLKVSATRNSCAEQPQAAPSGCGLGQLHRRGSWPAIVPMSCSTPRQSLASPLKLPPELPRRCTCAHGTSAESNQERHGRVQASPSQT